MAALAGGGAWIGSGGAARFFKKFGGRLVKGGFYGTVAGFIVGPIIDFLEEGVFKAELPPEEKADMDLAIVSAISAAAIFGPKGALLALLAVGLKGIYDVLTDPEKGLKDVSTTSWASLAISGIGRGAIALKWLGAAGLGAAAPATVAALIAAWPALLAVGIGLTIGLGLNWISGKFEEYEKEMMEHLEKIATLSKVEFIDALKENEIKWKERLFGQRIAMLLGDDPSDISATGQLSMGASHVQRKIKYTTPPFYTFLHCPLNWKERD